MLYKSTRNSQLRLEASQVIVQGISEEGGLFVPESFPDLSGGELPKLIELEYPALAKVIFKKFLTDFTEDEIAACVDKAYTKEKFGDKSPVKLVSLPKNGEHKFLLELWHGPTCAFKDMALQILPQFLTTALRKNGGGKEAVILTATSGDTGKAALEGFKDVPGTRILVFYPRDGVSPMQKRQMATQEGQNVAVCAIEGNFDDAQAGVKAIFTNSQLKSRLLEHNMLFSSANSINWGRLLPQIVYYVYAYLELVRTEQITLGKPMDVVVPTGNFGNILAAYYARKMGLPIRKLVCASNANNVLTDFIRTGTYDRRREFYATSSPSMDILISSNLERLLYDLSGEDSSLLSSWMKGLSENGVYSVGEAVLKKVQELFYGGFCGESGTAQTVRELWEKEHYLCDTHTAVAVDVYRQYLGNIDNSSVPAVIASTANPYKFSASVLEALGQTAVENDFENLGKLEEITGINAPEQLRRLCEKEERFAQIIPKDQAAEYVLTTLGIGG